MILISNSAKKHFLRLLSNQKLGTQIRVFVIDPGTPGAEFGISFCSQETVVSTDIKLKFDGFFVYIDIVSVPFLEGAEIDFVTDKFNSQLTLKAPNIRICKLNNDASLFDRVEYFLRNHINSQLINHGGKVSLIEITDDMLVILNFGGSCNGCAMVNYTLKEGIEKELLKKFPELKGVCDLTNHDRGIHSYY